MIRELGPRTGSNSEPFEEDSDDGMITLLSSESDEEFDYERHPDENFMVAAAWDGVSTRRKDGDRENEKDGKNSPAPSWETQQ